MRAAILVLVFALDAACWQSLPVTPPIASVADAGPDAGDAEEVVIYRNKTPCSRACAQMRALGCPEGYKQDGGDSCDVICTRAMRTLSIAPSCIIDARTRAEVRSCGAIRCQ
jgi:hypothetical protein